MQLSSRQLFILALAALAILAAVAYLDLTYRPLVVAAVLGILGVGGAQHASAAGAAHVVQGLQLGVPLSAGPPAVAAAPVSEVVNPPGGTGGTP